ncbi:hypothetical protein Tco_0886041, partial [Tanacetum coccineum]
RKQIRRKRANDEAGMNAPPKVLRKDYVYNPTHSTHGGKSLAGMWFSMGSSFATPAAQGTPPVAKNVRDPDPLSYARPQPSSEQDITQSSKGEATEIPTEDADTTVANVQLSVGSLKSGRSTYVPSMVGSPRVIYQPRWSVTNDCRLDTPEAYQNMVDHIIPSGYFSELRQLPNAEFLSQLLKKARSKIARWDQRIQVREEEIKKLDKEIQSLRSMEAEVQDIRNQTKNLKTLLEAEADMKNATEAKNAELAKELDSLFTGKEKIKASLEEFKKYKDTKVEKHYAEMDARLDALSIDFDEELYPHILTDFADVVSAGIAKGFCKGVKHGVEHGEVKLNLADIEAYDPKAEGKFITAMQALKELKYLLIDEIENLKDAPMDIIMASLYLKSDTGEDAPQWIRDLCPSVSQLKIPVYPEVRDPKDPWAFKKEMLLEDAVAANISQAKKKKKCRIVCRTHGVGFAHHASSDEVLVSALTVIPQGLQILLEDAAIQTELPEDKASPRLIRSKSLPAMYNLNWS